MTVNNLSDHLRVTPNAIGKQMQLIQSLGVVVREPGTCYQLAPPFRPAPGELSVDFGLGLIRIESVAAHSS